MDAVRGVSAESMASDHRLRHPSGRTLHHMPEIFHIARNAAWEAARDAGEPYTMSTRDMPLEQVGFIHCSATLDQVDGVLRRLYTGVPGLVLLVIDTDRLDAPVRYEPADGDLFPHVYGPIPAHAVIDVRPIAQNR